MQLTGKIVRLKIAADKPDQALDYLTNAQPVVPRGFDLEIDLGVYFKTNPVDLGNLASLTLQVFSKDRTGDALMQRVVAASAITATLADADWASGAAQHARFLFTGLETALEGSAGGTEYWLFVYGLTAGSPGAAVPIGGGTIKVVEEGPQNASLTPPPILLDVYSKEESDARYGNPSQLSIPAGKRLVINPDTNEITVETIT